LSLKALYIMLIYVVLNIGYCFFLKHIPIIDITIIAIGFILRIYVGSYVANVPLSSWIVMMTFLIALFLAIAKRRDDVLHFMKTGTKMRKVVNGYNLKFIDSSMSVMSAVIIVTYLLYTSSSEVIERLDNEYLFATSIFVILGILRYMQITFVEENSGSPTKILLKDKFIISTVVGWLLSFALIIYI
jgi:decaprenyl-phosphate phosphoribosyltransferase